MKTTALTLTLLTAVFFTSCEKEPSEPVEYNSTHEISLNQNELYVHPTGFSGDEEGGRISLQAKNFSISELTRDSLMDIIYQYKPDSNFVGLDTVQVLIQSGWDGESGFGQHYYYNFYFEIE